MSSCRVRYSLDVNLFGLCGRLFRDAASRELSRYAQAPNGAATRTGIHECQSTGVAARVSTQPYFVPTIIPLSSCKSDRMVIQTLHFSGADTLRVDHLKSLKVLL